MSQERMPSRVSSLSFTVSIDGTWHMESSEAQPEQHASASLARHHLREHAARTLRRRSVLEVAAAEDAVNAIISRPLSPSPGLTVHGTACLTVSETDRNFAKEHLRRTRQGDLEREETRRRIEFLQDVLSDPARRTAWWIDQYPDRLAELPVMKTAVQDITPPRDSTRDTVQDEVAHFVDQLLAEMRTPQQREVFLRALTQTLRVLGSADLQKATASWISSQSVDPGADTE